MAVPKKKTSVTKKGHRRAGQHHKLYAKNVTTCSETGEYALRHCVSPAGYYKGKQIFEIKEKSSDDTDSAE